jgi:type I restriction enzyme M protein
MKPKPGGQESTLIKAWAAFDDRGREFWTQMDGLVEMLEDVLAGEAADA